ncbi:MAG: septum formation initiator family protein [Candidatus Firestonebacteria bacterium]
MLTKRNRFKRYKIKLPTKIKYKNLPYSENLKKIIKIFLIIGILYLFLGGRTGLVRLIEFKMERNKLQNENNQMTEENKKALEEIKALNSDPKFIERIAREELGLVKKGEIVYRFITVKKKDK